MIVTTAVSSLKMTSFFISELNKLKNIQLNLEKNDHLANILFKHDNELNLLTYFKELERKRKSETDRINHELREILFRLDSKKNLVQTQELETIDLKSFKKDMIDLQERIQNLKLKLKIELGQIQDEEKDLSEQNEIYNQRILEWEKPPSRNFSIINFKVTRHTRTEFNNCKEVKEFMDFVTKTGGHENGWSSEDHLLFLKIRRKHRDVDKLAQNLHKLLPDISEDEIIRHEAWYKRYLFLKNKKKEALNKWREAKTENLAKTDDKKDTDDKVKSVAKNCLKPLDQNIHEKLALWKAEKQAEKERQKEFAAMMRLRTRKTQEERRKLNAEVKKSVEKWREAKTMKEENEKVQKEIMEYKERKLKAAEANRMIKQFRSQDDLFVTRMKSSKQKEKKDVAKRSKSSNLVSRDPERIFKPTKQWLFRTAKNDNLKTNPISVPNISSIAKLAVPDWRKT